MQLREHGALLDSNSCLVLVVDMQEAFRTGLRSFSSILPKAMRIVNGAQSLGIPLMGSEQSPQKMGSTVAEILQITPPQQFYAKESFSAMQSAAILEAVASAKAKSIVLLGCETHVAVLQTALHLLSTFDSDVHLVVDATTSRRDQDRDLALARMQRAGVHLTSVEMVLFEWVRDTRHPRFQTIGSSGVASSSSRAPESSSD